MIEMSIRCLPGTTIYQACSEALRLARLLSVNMSFEFNTVVVCVRPGSLIEDAVEAFNKAIKEHSPFAIA